MTGMTMLLVILPFVLVALKQHCFQTRLMDIFNIFKCVLNAAFNNS